MKKLPIVISSSAMSLIVGAALVVAFSPTSTAAEIDLPYVNTRIDNLDARQTNTENDIKSLQAATSTAPADHVVVPAAPDPAIAATPATLPAAPDPAPSTQSTTAPAAPVAPVVFVPYTTSTSPDSTRRLTGAPVRVPPECEQFNAVDGL